jgi:hypothetical protein
LFLIKFFINIFQIFTSDSRLLDDDTLNKLLQKIEKIHEDLKKQRELNEIREKYPSEITNQNITDKEINDLFNEIVSLYNGEKLP